MTHSKAKWLQIFLSGSDTFPLRNPEKYETESQTLSSFKYVMKLTGEVFLQARHLVNRWQIFHSYRSESTGLALAVFNDLKPTVSSAIMNETIPARIKSHTVISIR